MSAFKVIEIIDAVTIRTEPRWSVTVKDLTQEREYIGNQVIISGLNVTANDEYAKHRLSTILLNKEVDLFSPQIVPESDQTNAVVRCIVHIEKTNVTYYFPEYSDKKTDAFFS